MFSSARYLASAIASTMFAGIIGSEPPPTPTPSLQGAPPPRKPARSYGLIWRRSDKKKDIFNGQKALPYYPGGLFEPESTRYKGSTLRAIRATGQKRECTRRLRQQQRAAAKRIIEQAVFESTDPFVSPIIVERNPDDPNRLDVYLPPDQANELRS